MSSPTKACNQGHTIGSHNPRRPVSWSKDQSPRAVLRTKKVTPATPSWECGWSKNGSLLVLSEQLHNQTPTHPPLFPPQALPMITMERELSQITTIEEETSADLLNESRKANAPNLSPRSAAKPRRLRSSGSMSSSLRSSGAATERNGGLLSLQLMSGSISALDTLNLEALPHETPRNRPPRSKERLEAKERLHNSMSALEGYSPEDLLQEVNRRRNERVSAHRSNKLAASMPSRPKRSTVDPKFHASMPVISSGDFESLEMSGSSLQHTPGGELVADAAEQRPTKRVIATRTNSSYLWQKGQDCWGALEVACELEFDYRAPLKTRYVSDKEEFMDAALKVWNDMKLADEFVQACQSVPPWTACCGMVRDDDRTIQDTAKTLQKGWIKVVNQRLKAQRENFKLDVYVWSWHNATGKAKTNILLIRFLNARR